MENPFSGDPFREDDADVEDVEDASDRNPYTIMEGYELEDVLGTVIGEIEETVYDAVRDVLKYVVVNGHTVPADGIEVNAEEERVRVPYNRETIGSAPPSKSSAASLTGGCVLTTRSPAKEGSKSALGVSHLSRLTPGISETLKTLPSSQPVRLTAGQGAERQAYVILLPATLHNQGQRSERQIELR